MPQRFGILWEVMAVTGAIMSSAAQAQGQLGLYVVADPPRTTQIEYLVQQYGHCARPRALAEVPQAALGVSNNPIGLNQRANQILSFEFCRRAHFTPATEILASQEQLRREVCRLRAELATALSILRETGLLSPAQPAPAPQPIAPPQAAPAC